MASGRRGQVAWFSPDPRGVLPLDGFHVPRSLRKRVRRGDYRVTFDEAFDAVIHQCAAPRAYERQTWINDDIIAAFGQLHRAGLAHSVEAWQDDAEGDAPPRLVGGLYGVALAGAFFGESMFSRATDASKVCLVHLVNHLRERGFVLLDTQFFNSHLMQFGVEEIRRDEFLDRLEHALTLDVRW